MTIGWFIAAAVLAIMEIFSLDLFFVMMALSAVGGGVTALLGGPPWLQVVVFAVISLLLLVVVRPWARRQLERSTPDIDTNARGLVGKTAIVTKPLTGPTGRVRLAGAEWSARGVDGAVFTVGTEVRVVQIDGATAVVGPPDLEVPVPPDSVPTLSEDGSRSADEPPELN